MIATERTKQTMAFQRDDLISLYGRDIVDADGSVVTLTNIEFLYSVIEQLMDRIEDLESMHSRFD
jgi:hypothetical protein